MVERLENGRDKALNWRESGRAWGGGGLLESISRKLEKRRKTFIFIFFLLSCDCAGEGQIDS